MRITNQHIDIEIIKTNSRLTLEIHSQNDLVTYKGPDDGPYWRFEASNGYQIISQSRADIQTGRIWLRGGVSDNRSGTMVFSSNKKRDAALVEFEKAIREWTEHVDAGNWGSGTPMYRPSGQIQMFKFDRLVEHCKQLEREIHNYRVRDNQRKLYEVDQEYWHWQTEGCNFLNSLTGNILIDADDLRGLLTHLGSNPKAWDDF